MKKILNEKLTGIGLLVLAAVFAMNTFLEYRTTEPTPSVTTPIPPQETAAPVETEPTPSVTTPTAPQETAAPVETEPTISVTTPTAPMSELALTPQPAPELTEPKPVPEPTEPKPVPEPTEPKPSVEPTEPEPVAEPTEPKPAAEPAKATSKVEFVSDEELNIIRDRYNFEFTFYENLEELPVYYRNTRESQSVQILSTHPQSSDLMKEIVFAVSLFDTNTGEYIDEPFSNGVIYFVLEEAYFEGTGYQLPMIEAGATVKEALLQHRHNTGQVLTDPDVFSCDIKTKIGTPARSGIFTSESEIFPSDKWQATAHICTDALTSGIARIANGKPAWTAKFKLHPDLKLRSPFDTVKITLSIAFTFPEESPYAGKAINASSKDALWITALETNDSGYLVKDGFYTYSVWSFGADGLSSPQRVPVTPSIPSTPSTPSTPSPSGVSANANALTSAAGWASDPFYESKQGTYDMLIAEGFTAAEAQYGANNVAADWYANAAQGAVGWANPPFNESKQGAYDMLIAEGFTAAEAQYGVDNVFN